MTHGRDIPGEVKAFIVRRLAIYDSYTEIRAAVLENFGIEIQSADISRYNPTVASSCLGADLKELFYQARQNFIEGLDDIGIVHKAYRLRRLDEMEREARAMGKISLSAKLLEQAASEVGGIFEKNKQGITLDVLQKELERLAAVVAKEVRDPETLAAIERGWGMEAKQDTMGSRIEKEWGV